MSFFNRAALAAYLDGATAWVAERRERLRTLGLAVALIVFVVGLLLAARATPTLGKEINLGWLAALILLSAPLGTLLNTIELRWLSRIAGGIMSWRTAAELTVYTSAANMMPLPGGAITKLAGMKAHGVGYGTASTVVVLSFVAWAGFTFLLSGIALAYLGQPAIAIAFVGLGILLLVGCCAGFARFKQWRLVAQIAVLRIVYFGVEILRYWAAFATIGVPLSLVQCSTFVVASVVGAAVVIAPQGLGVVEVTAAALATLIGISAGIGFIVAALQRLVRLAGLAVITPVFIVIRKKVST